MSIREYVLSEQNWKNLKNQKFELAVLPWGSTEAHNYHLPYSTDSYQSDYIAQEAAKIAYENEAKVIVLPNIPFGVNIAQLKINLTISINPSTQLQILKDIVDSLIHHEINKLVIINGHGGNDFKPMIRELQNVFPDFFIGLINWYKVLKEEDYFDEPGEHAGELETSNMLFIRPDLVLPIDKAGSGKDKKIDVYGFREGWAWSPRLWHKATKDTGIGNPAKASKEKGEKYLKETVKNIAQTLIELSKADLNKIYK